MEGELIVLPLMALLPAGAAIEPPVAVEPCMPPDIALPVIAPVFFFFLGAGLDDMEPELAMDDVFDMLEFDVLELDGPDMPVCA